MKTVNIETAKINVMYFKKSGKWYTDEEISVPQNWLERLADESFSSSFTMYEFRNWLETEIQHNEFIAVVSLIQNDKQAGLLLGYPMMVHPTESR